jgi:general secretion pathway protein I
MAGDSAVIRPGARSGFTLLEVMVALAVLAGALMALADLSGSALRNFGYSRDLSVATLLARGKMAEIEEKYEDSGFTDFDEAESGTFADQGQPGIRWNLELKRPDGSMSAEQLLGAFLGTGGDDVGTQELLGKLLGGASAAGGKGGPSSAAPGGLLGGVLQTQLTAFSEELKKSVRLAVMKISWKDGKTEHAFDISTYMVVLNPKAPGGARGPNPDIPPNLAPPARSVRLPGVPGVGPGQKVDPNPRNRRRGGGTE